MQKRCLVLIILPSLALGLMCTDVQAGEAHRQSDNKRASAPDPVSSVAPDDSVITMEGVCDEIPWSIATPVGRSKASSSPTSQSKYAGCKTMITRAGFENLASAILRVSPLKRTSSLLTSTPNNSSPLIEPTNSALIKVRGLRRH